MSRFYGGQTAGKGTYWNLFSGESIELSDNSVLPGNRSARYLKIPRTGIFVLGPLFGLLFVCLIPLISVIVVLTLLSRIALASDALKSEEAGMCLGCHSGDTIKVFKNKEKLSVHISESQFKDTVHSFLTCTGCHSDISMDNHPSAQYESKKDFALKLSGSCRACHSEQILAKPLHGHAVTKANAPPCSDCHGSHSIRRIAEWKEKASSTQYCLTCHKQELSITMNGETLSLSVSESSLKKSVHSNHNCSDCHESFSKKTHPIKNFGSKRELSIDISGVCRKCHPEKYVQFQGSIHADILKGGNSKAPVCTDCHGAHTVSPRAIVETMSGVPCRKCHEGIYEAYKESVHGKAKMKGKTEAPLCSSCHFAHDVKPALASRSPKATCIGCHKNAPDLHKEWLPNSDLHLDAVACTACHVPDVERRVYLRITSRSSGEMMSEQTFKKVLESDFTNLTNAGANGIEGQQIWNIFRKFGEKEADANLTGTLGLQDCSKSHSLAPKAKAIKQCDKCHSADSEYFKNVSMAVIKPDGREELYNVNPAVLNSMFTILPLNQFYALGSTRIKILDIIGILMVVGGMSVPVAHITLRLLTSPIREAKRLNKMRKEGRK